MTDTPDEPAAPLPASHWVAPEPAAVRPPRSARVRSRVAILALGASGGLGGLAFLQDLTGFAILDSAEAGTLSLDDANAFDALFGQIGLIQFGLFIVAAVAFLAWLSRSVDNTPGLGGGTPTAIPAWSIGWWFIPFANLVKPYQVVADLYRRMAPTTVGTAIVLSWWLLWVLNGVLVNIAGRLWAADDIETMRSGLLFWSVTDLGDAVTAMLAIVIIFRIQTWADARAVMPPAAPENEPHPAKVVAPGSVAE